MSICDILTQKQIDGIISTINERCKLFHDRNEDLYYGPYVSMRKQHALTSAVLTGFAPENISIEGISSKDVHYGLLGKMCQPELFNENAIIHIYSSNANIETNNLVRERCKQYNTDIKNSKPIFCIIRFRVKNDQLIGLTMLLPNNEVKIVEEYEIKIP